MLKKALLRLGVCAVVLAALVWYFFFDMGRLPKGTLVASCPSPALTHTVNIYECAGNATTADSVRAEVVTGGASRNIYWQYKADFEECEWLSEDEVCINGTRLNVLNDTYDWRR